MILDKQNMFSEDQAITATADSTNVIDLEAAGHAKGTPIEVWVQVTTDFATLTSLTVTLDASAVEGMTDAVTLGVTGAIAAADLVAGYKFTLPSLPYNTLQYLELTYTVDGSNAAAGAVSAGLVLDQHTNTY